MSFLYNFLLTLLWPLAALYMLWRHYGLKKSAAAWWGRIPVDVPEALKSTFPRFWLHAVSVGEVMAARPVARALREQFPHCGIVISTTTDTGQTAAQQCRERGEFDAVFYFPIDFTWTVRRVFNQVQPDAILLMETELWPNFLHIAHQRGIGVFQVNGRVSDNLLHQARRWGALWRWMMGNITAIFARSDLDANRFRDLNVDPSKVLLTGDVKLDGMETHADSMRERQRARQILGINEDDLLWIAGSTHEGEEVLLLQTHQQLQLHLGKRLHLMLAPRHPERVDEVTHEVQKAGFTVLRRSRLNAENPGAADMPPVILLDTVGELAGFYAAADAAFVGGSLIQRGGHNVLEPVLAGVPVLFGPHMYNFRDIATLVQNAEVGQMVQSQTELTTALQSWLSDPTQRQHVMKNTQTILSAHQGAARRVAEAIEQRIKTPKNPNI